MKTKKNIILSILSLSLIIITSLNALAAPDIFTHQAVNNGKVTAYIQCWDDENVALQITFYNENDTRLGYEYDMGKEKAGIKNASKAGWSYAVIDYYYSGDLYKDKTVYNN